tara:strand:+ start:2003 stop:2143 length:141 start_codon:yes stop_codon:yes gene_type:complete
MVAKVSMGLIPPPFWINNSAELSNNESVNLVIIIIKATIIKLLSEL